MKTIELDDLFEDFFSRSTRPRECKICERGKKFKQIIAKLDDAADREFLEGFYNSVLDTETELEMLQCEKDKK